MAEAVLPWPLFGRGMDPVLLARDPVNPRHKRRPEFRAHRCRRGASRSGWPSRKDPDLPPGFPSFMPRVPWFDRGQLRVERAHGARSCGRQPGRRGRIAPCWRHWRCARAGAPSHLAGQVPRLGRTGVKDQKFHFPVRNRVLCQDGLRQSWMQNLPGRRTWSHRHWQSRLWQSET